MPGTGRGTRDVVQSGVLVGQADVDHVDGLGPEVELAQDDVGERVQHPGGVGDAGLAAQPIDDGAEDGHDPQVGLEPGPQPGPLHLDHDLGAVVEAGVVGLGDAGGAARLRVEPGEQLRHGTAQGGGDGRLGGLGRHGRNLVPAPGEGLDPLVGEDALGGGDALAHLHVGGPARLDETLRPPYGRRRPARPAPARSQGADHAHEQEPPEAEQGAGQGPGGGPGEPGPGQLVGGGGRLLLALGHQLVEADRLLGEARHLADPGRVDGQLLEGGQRGRGHSAHDGSPCPEAAPVAVSTTEGRAEITLTTSMRLTPPADSPAQTNWAR